MSTSEHSAVVAPVDAEEGEFHFEYTVHKGVFMQSEDETDDTKFDFKKTNFGLIPRSYPTDAHADDQRQWKRLEKYVRSLAATASWNERVKLLFLGRHGQGWHNVAETKYGTEAWDCYWSALDGADGITWADAHLTPVGEAQAKDVRDLWAAQIPLGIPLPEKYYVSPLTRTIQTADQTFSSLPLPATHAYKPLIKELLREALGIHTCDRRSTRSHIHTSFPHVVFEPGFAQNDHLWLPDYREPRSARRYRLAVLLDELFSATEEDGEGRREIFVSLTSHSGAIGSILQVLGHRAFALETGGVIPVLLSARRVSGKRAVPPKEPSDAPPLCPEPPPPTYSSHTAAAAADTEA
ncbi:putative phosphoglycerate mutase pmu1 [Exserohilum turcicum]